MILHKVVDSCTIRVWSDNICDWRDLPLKLHLREHEYTAKPVLQRWVAGLYLVKPRTTCSIL